MMAMINAEQARMALGCVLAVCCIVIIAILVSTALWPGVEADDANKEREPQ